MLTEIDYSMLYYDKIVCVAAVIKNHRHIGFASAGIFFTRNALELEWVLLEYTLLLVLKLLIILM